jgi:UDP-N-acetylglucosamine 1-carboxyvinyltransferase
VPRIRDVETMVELLADLGADADWTGRNEVRVHAAGITKHELDEALLPPDRASFLLAGPLLARLGRVVVPPPGGGRDRPAAPRPATSHALAELGVDISIDGRLRHARRLAPRAPDLPRRGEL